MNVNSSKLLDAALELPDDQRASLVYQLLQSLKPPGVSSESDPGLGAELERRAANYDAGETEASDWNDVAARLREE